MKTQEYFKKDNIILYYPQLSDEEDLVSGKMVIKMRERKDGVLVLLADYKEPPLERELSGHNGIDDTKKVFD